MLKDDSHATPDANSGVDNGLTAGDERFRLLVDSVLDYGIFMLDVTGRHGGHRELGTAGAERINGYRADEIIGKHFSTFYPATDVASGKCERELAIAEQAGRFEEEGFRIRKGGERFWVNVVITAIRNRQGELSASAR